jgi:flagellar biosynthesis/type III secretory pathway protein FliH
MNENELLEDELEQAFRQGYEEGLKATEKRYNSVKKTADNYIRDFEKIVKEMYEKT